MLGRIPHARLIGPAYLPHHKIVFAGRSAIYGGAATATVVPAMSSVPGALYRLSREDLRTLDDLEGGPSDNHRHNEYVCDLDGNRHEAFMYQKSSGTPRGTPHPDYVWLIVLAHLEFGFPIDEVLREAGMMDQPSPVRVAARYNRA